MSEVYETVYGIFNHVSNAKSPPSKRRPLANIAFHKGEDFTTGSLLEDTMRVFSELPIREMFGYNYSEFMKLPVDIAELIVKKARERHEKDMHAAANADTKLKGSITKHQQSIADNLRLTNPNRPKSK